MKLSSVATMEYGQVKMQNLSQDFPYSYATDFSISIFKGLLFRTGKAKTILTVQLGPAFSHY